MVCLSQLYWFSALRKGVNLWDFTRSLLSAAKHLSRFLNCTYLCWSGDFVPLHSRVAKSKGMFAPPQWAYIILWCANSRVRKTPWGTRKGSFGEGRESLLPRAPSSAVTAKRWKVAAELFQINAPPKLTWCESLSGPALNRRFIFPRSSVLLASRDASAKGGL